MKIAAALFGFLILAVAFVVWYRAYKAIRGEDSSLFSSGSGKPGKENNSIEEFIAAYKRGEVPVGDSAPLPAKAATRTPPALPAATVPGQAAATAQATPTKRDAFVSGSTKLVYLACKAGLRDHHIFAHVPVSALSTGCASEPSSTVDLLICNAAMSPVAAIDLIDADSSSANPAKSDFLKMLGIRYLRLTAKSLPRPDELHALLYKM